jgi:CBS domain-containing protein
MNDVKVADVMTHLVVTLRPRDTIEEAARRLLYNRISGAPVVEDGRLVGVVSEADLMRAYAPPARSGTPFIATEPLMFLLEGTSLHSPRDETVGGVMTETAISVSPVATVWQAASMIDRHGVRRLPVVDDDGFVVGVLARSDLVRAMTRYDRDSSSSAYIERTYGEQHTGSAD